MDLIPPSTHPFFYYKTAMDAAPSFASIIVMIEREISSSWMDVEEQGLPLPPAQLSISPPACLIETSQPS